jgi:hypothetical protein
MRPIKGTKNTDESIGFVNMLLYPDQQTLEHRMNTFMKGSNQKNFLKMVEGGQG